METVKNMFMAVIYKMYAIEDGESELTEEATAQHPFQFVSGLSMTLDAFEKQLEGLGAGDAFDFTIPVNEAYGEYDSEHIYELSKDMFCINGKFDSGRVAKDAVLPMRTEDGKVLYASVSEVKDDTVVMDFNHPLAGCALRFKGRVVESRPATNEEVVQAANALSHTGCGGECGGCGGGCGDCGCGSCG